MSEEYKGEITAGMRFGDMVVSGVNYIGDDGYIRYTCLCDCGHIIVNHENNLRKPWVSKLCAKIQLKKINK